MLEGPGQFVTVFQTIRQHFESNPAYFQTDGLFRMSGAQPHAQEILRRIYRGEEAKLGDFTVHDCVSALKGALGEKAWLKREAPYVQSLSEFINGVNLEPESAPAVIEQAFNEFFKELIRSNNKSFAEAMFEYGYLIKQTSKFSEINKMTASNLAIIFCPAWMNNVLSPVDPLKSHSKIIATLTKLIETSLFDQSFCLKYKLELSAGDMSIKVRALNATREAFKRVKPKIKKAHYKSECKKIEKEREECLAQLASLEELIGNDNKSNHDELALELNILRFSMSDDLTDSSLSSAGSSRSSTPIPSEELNSSSPSPSRWS